MHPQSPLHRYNNNSFNHKDRDSYAIYNGQNPEDQTEQNQDAYDFESRLAKIGKKRYKLEVPVFQRKSQLINE